MKTFKEYLLEDEFVLDFETLITNNCADFLEESRHQGLLYRGLKLSSSAGSGYCMMGDEKVPYWGFEVRKDRKPMNTPEVISTAVDDWFDAKFGIRARSQAIFCFGEGAKNTASLYGQTRAIIFPIGKIRYIWSDKVTDLYDEINLDILTGGFSRIKDEYQTADGELDTEKLGYFLDKMHYKSMGLGAAVRSSGEIMIECNKYIAFRYDTGLDHAARHVLNIV